MKQIFYSPHLLLRLKVREIPHNLPRQIYQNSQERYFDKETLKNVALMKLKFKNKERELALIYEELKDKINLITIHPLKANQKESRIEKGRWEKI